MGALSRQSRIAGSGVEQLHILQSSKEAFCRSEVAENSRSSFSATLQRIALPKYFEV